MDDRYFELDRLWDSEDDYYVKGSKREITVPNGFSILMGYEPRKKVKKVIIPRGVKRIEAHCFSGWKSLRDIVFPDTIESIGEGAFEGTEWLKNQSDDLILVKDVVLMYKGNEKNIIIPDGIRFIENGAFKYSSVESVTLPGSLECIGDEAFMNCINLSNVYTMNKSGLKWIGDRAFFGCCSLKNVSFIKRNIELGTDCVERTAFMNRFKGDFVIAGETLIRYRGNDSFPVIPEGVIKIGPRAFAHSNVRHVELSEDIKEIGEAAFSGCTYLEDIDLPDSIEKIGDSAFEGCILLNNVHLPDSLTEVECGSFQNCLSLEEIVVPPGVKSILSGAFSGCIHLKKVNFKGNIDLFGRCAFSECASLGEIIIHGNDFSFDRDVFWNCVSLESVSFPDVDDSTTIQMYPGLFHGCVKLKTINAPIRLSSILPGAFIGCMMLDTSFIINDIEDVELRKEKMSYIGMSKEEWEKIING